MHFGILRSDGALSVYSKLYHENHKNTMKVDENPIRSV